METYIMKIKSIIFSVSLLFFVIAPAYGQRWARSTKYVDGYKFTFKITEGELQTYRRGILKQKMCLYPHAKPLKLREKTLSDFCQNHIQNGIWILLS